MKDYGRVRSCVKPESVVIDDFSVSENIGEENEFVGYEFSMIQYGKDEFILKQATENAAIQQQITDTQLALCEVYELMG